jgi:hypothetical protein
VYGPTRDLILWTNRNDPKDLPNAVNKAHDSAVKMLSELMNLGVQTAEPGSIRWQGDTFETTNSKNGYITNGRLLKDEFEKPKEILLQVQTPNPAKQDYEVYSWRLRYDYGENPILGFLPTTVQRFLEPPSSGIKPILFSEMTIHSIQTNSSLQAKEAFLPEAYLLPEKSRTLYVSNSFLRGLHKGQWHLVHEKRPDLNTNIVRITDLSGREALAPGTERLVRIAYVTATFGLSLVAMIWYKRHSRLTKKKKDIL